MRTCLIDSDELKYRVALNYQKIKWVIKKEDRILGFYYNKYEAINSIADREDLELESEVEPLPINGFENYLDGKISEILYKTNSTDFKHYLNGDSNFRYKLATLLPYKGNRIGSSEPYYLETVRNELVNRGAEVIDFLESDDLLSANYTILTSKGRSCIICSQDKDLRTVSSWNYNTGKDVLQLIDEDTARYNFFMQLLIGDSVDNIPSPWKLGEVTATKILNGMLGKSSKDYYQHIIPFYEKFLTAKCKDGEYKTKWYKDQDIDSILHEIGNLLWMRRTLDPEERWSVY